MADDPFTAGMKATWTAITDNVELAALVEPKNFIDYTGDSISPSKEQRSTRDLPELGIFPGDFEADLFQTSHSSRAALGFEFRLLSGDKRINQDVYPILYNLFPAFYSLKATIAARTVTGLRFFTFGTGEVAEAPEEAGAAHWLYLGTLTLHYQFAHGDF